MFVPYFKIRDAEENNQDTIWLCDLLLDQTMHNLDGRPVRNLHHFMDHHRHVCVGTE